MEINRAVAKTAFVHQLKTGSETVVGEGALAAADDYRHEEKLVLVNQPSVDRLGRKLRTSDGQIAARSRLQLPLFE